ETGERIALSDVELQAGSALSCPLNVVNNGFGRVSISPPGDDDVRTGFGERERGGPAEATASASDESCEFVCSGHVLLLDVPCLLTRCRCFRALQNTTLRTVAAGRLTTVSGSCAVIAKSCKAPDWI